MSDNSKGYVEYLLGIALAGLLRDQNEFGSKACEVMRDQILDDESYREAITEIALTEHDDDKAIAQIKQLVASFVDGIYSCPVNFLAFVMTTQSGDELEYDPVDLNVNATNEFGDSTLNTFFIQLVRNDGKEYMRFIWNAGHEIEKYLPLTGLKWKVSETKGAAFTDFKCLYNLGNATDKAQVLELLKQLYENNLLSKTLTK